MSIKAKVIRAEKPGFPTLGVLIIFIGLVFLLDALGIISRSWSIIWPSLLIILGLSMLYKHYKN